MSDLIKQVTPLTRGIIWLVKDETNTNNPHYADIDYLLDGLLTANLKQGSDVSSRVIVGQNFNQPLFVMIAKEVKSNELESFAGLLKDLNTEHDIILIDETGSSEQLRKQFGKFSSHLKVIQ